MLQSRNVNSPARKPARLGVEKLEAREVLYAVSGSAWIHPEMITIGFVPDGTALGAYTSNLQSTFDNHTNATFRSTWRSQILKAAQVWAQQTNINFVLVSDNGASIGSGPYQQGDPNMADIRIGGYNFGTSTLAQAYMPPASNGISSSGDMQFNTGQLWNINATYDLFTVAMHEFGHSLGLYHGASGSAMNGGYTSTKPGLTGDDVAGIQAVVGWSAGGFTSPGYGGARTQDNYDGGAGNGSFASATDFTGQINTTTRTALLQNLDITTTADNDYFKFTVPSGLGGSLTVKVQSSGLSLLAPQVALFNSAQGSLTSATAGTDYDGATLTLSYSVTAGQTYYVKVAGANATANGTGKYALALGFASTAAPTAASPNTLTNKDQNCVPGGGQAIGLGPETRVNTTTAWMQSTVPQSTGSLSRPPRAITMDAGGNYVVTWMSYGQIGFTWDVYAQRYNAAGVPQGGEFLVNTTTVGSQLDPAVAMDGAGNFVIAWADNNATTYDIYAQRFDAAGNKLGAQFLVNTTTANGQEAPFIARNASGAFVIVWNSYNQDGSGYGVYGQRYDANGVKQGGEFRLNTTTVGNQYQPTLAIDAAGGFVATWASVNLTTSASNVIGQRFNSAGAKVGGEFQVNTSAIGAASSGAIAMDGTGGFIVAYAANEAGDYNIRVRRFNNSGVALGNDFIATTTTTGAQTNPNVAINAGGYFFVTWDNQDYSDASSGVFAQQFTSTGAKQGLEFRVNTTTAGGQTCSSMAMDSNGDAVIVWSGSGPGDGSGVFAQRFMVSYGGMNPMEAAEPHGFGPNGCGCGCPTCSASVAVVEPLQARVRQVVGVEGGLSQLLNSLLTATGGSTGAATAEPNPQFQDGQDHDLNLLPEAGTQSSRDGGSVFASSATPGKRSQAAAGDSFCISAPAFGVSWQWLSPLSVE